MQCRPAGHEQHPCAPIATGVRASSLATDAPRPTLIPAQSPVPGIECPEEVLLLLAIALGLSPAVICIAHDVLCFKMHTLRPKPYVTPFEGRQIAAVTRSSPMVL